jgi:hypothetical protein
MLVGSLGGGLIPTCFREGIRWVARGAMMVLAKVMAHVRIQGEKT